MSEMCLGRPCLTSARIFTHDKSHAISFLELAQEIGWLGMGICKWVSLKALL